MYFRTKDSYLTQTSTFILFVVSSAENPQLGDGEVFELGVPDVTSLAVTPTRLWRCHPLINFPARPRPNDQYTMQKKKTKAGGGRRLEQIEPEQLLMYKQ